MREGGEGGREGGREGGEEGREGMCQYIELNNRAQSKNAIKFPFSVTISKFIPYNVVQPHSL